MEHTFETPGPIDLYVENARGRVAVTAADVARTEVRIAGPQADEFVVEHDGDRVAVVSPRGGGFLRKDPDADVRIVVPCSSSLTAKVASSLLLTDGPLGATWVSTGSGDVVLDRVEGTCDVQSGSGNLRIGHLDLEGRIKSGSGDVHVDVANGSLVISTGSGDVRVDSPGSALAVKSGSGDVMVGAASRGQVTARSATGDIGIGLAAGTPVWTDINTVTGCISSTLPSTGEPTDGQDFVEVRATTVSGDVSLRAAAG